MYKVKLILLLSRCLYIAKYLDTWNTYYNGVFILVDFRHWDEFYSKDDLQTLAEAGITHLRIPVGYWIFDVVEKEPFPEPAKNDESKQRYYLRRLIKWADQLKLKVLVDLHAAPGSQNGFDNSGRMGLIGKTF